MSYQDLINLLLAPYAYGVSRLEIDGLRMYLYLLEEEGRVCGGIQYRTSLDGFGRLEVELRGTRLGLLGYMI